MSVAAVLAVLAVLLLPGGGRDDRAPPRAGFVRRVRLVVGRLRAVSRPAPGADWVADLGDVTGVGLVAGLDVHRAVLAAGRSPAVARAAPWLAERVGAALRDGGSVSSCLSDPPGDLTAAARDDLGVLARALRLIEETGAPASGVVLAAATAVREGAAVRARTEAAVAGPRASMRLLTALPLVGPLGGVLLGLDPASLYGSPAARASLAAGVVLTALGWLLARRLVARARRPLGTDGRVR
ncbi:hypothetical protein KC207_08800 [Phycicoccus sp. BSK3Z-2]|uniref:Type II secretion system protein GspF domain-containing protein n=1 Tax=Phycicoccus avicenniae TaxID=2828860 RepID=A0A941D870_9MICO|nr:hypothetical protein [Phycicoccus avicenniae]MBR7743386.1 hypothetical protein [Phycicoccus avicenniae]